MDLNEIEAEADLLLVSPRDAGVQESQHIALKLQGLAHASQIKSNSALRAHVDGLLPDPGVPSYGTIATDPDNVRMPDGSVFRKHVWNPGCCTISTEHPVHLPEPTKPVADQLHELVSYFKACADEHREQARVADPIEAPIYDDAATKLQDILQEGGL